MNPLLWCRNLLRRVLRALWRIRPRRAAALPLMALVAVTDLWLRAHKYAPLPTVVEPEPLRWQPGVSVVIPERGGGAMLERCLESLMLALVELDEPHEVIIIVNGAPAAEYASLQTRWPGVVWRFHATPLGFTTAALHGARLARFGAVYLLNNDMLMARQALAALLPCRDPGVFALASEIHFEKGRRREETGWTFMPVVAGMPAPYHAPLPNRRVRRTAWAGAGAALFHTPKLLELLPGSLPFDPFYWEDADLGARAWDQGYQSLVCPDSQVVHGHRVTVQRFYAPSEVQRIFERNRLLYRLRHPLPLEGTVVQLERIARLDDTSLSELRSGQSLGTLWRQRLGTRTAPGRRLFVHLGREWHDLNPRRGKPLLLLVTPFALLPPRHGGAVRSLGIARELAQDFDIALLSDERSLYPQDLEPWASIFCMVDLVEGRPELAPAASTDRRARLRNHAHSKLVDELRHLVAMTRPAAIIIEHMELAPLVEALGAHRPPCVLALHDVLLTPDDPAQSRADIRERQLINAFDAVTVCSEEDRALLDRRDVLLVPNGVSGASLPDYQPSPDDGTVLFVGPFRAGINWQGILNFVEAVWPEVVAELPRARLLVVGGRGAYDRTQEVGAFCHPSIETIDEVDDLTVLWQRAALSINPQPELRGSSLKVIESLVAGRICVSTTAGARGWGHLQCPALIRCAKLSDFASVITGLLRDPKRRHALERPADDLALHVSWAAATEPLRAYLRQS